MACFPLVPYANRIAHGRFSFAGREHRVPLNFGDHPHSLHGLGWHRPWQVTEADGGKAKLVHLHAGGPGWPWRYRAEQIFRLDETGLRIELAVTNEDREATPVGLGFHPYFPAGAQTRLAFHSEQVWLVDDTILPTHPAAADQLGAWSTGASIASARSVDHSYGDWDGEVLITEAGQTIRLTAHGARHLHLYIPPGQDFFCAEPVSHLPDALNQGFEMDVLEPGETLRLALEIGFEA